MNRRAVFDNLSLARSPPANSLESLWQDHSAFSVFPRANGVTRAVDQSRASLSPGPSQLQSHRYPALAVNSAPLGSANTNGQGIQAKNRARTLQEIETEMLLNAQIQREKERQEREREELLQQELEQQRLNRQHQYQLLRQQQQQQQQQEQLLLQQQERSREQERLREQELLRQRMLYQQQEQLQRQRLLQQQRELQQQPTPPPRMMPTSQSPRFPEQQRQLLLLQQYEEQQRRLQLEEQLRREDLERQMLAMNLERGRVDSPLYNGRRLQRSTSAEMQESQFLQQAYERQLQLQQHQHRRQSSRSPAISSSQHTAPFPQERHDALMQQRLLAELVAHGELPANFHGISKADQEALRVEAMRKIVEAEKMEEKRRRKAAKIAHMVRTDLFDLQFLKPCLHQRPVTTI